MKHLWTMLALAAGAQPLFSVAPEVRTITTPVLMLIGDADYELGRMVNGRCPG